MYIEQRNAGRRPAPMAAIVTRALVVVLLTTLAFFLSSGAPAGGLQRRSDRPDAHEDDGPTGRWRRARTERDDELTLEERREIKKLQSLGYLAGSSPAPVEMGVVYYETDRASNGLNFFTSGHFAGAVLMDMEGGVLHEWSYDFLDAWPGETESAENDGAEYWRWAHLYENGDVLAIFEGLGLIKVDSDSRLLWKHLGSEHHDLEVTEDGSIYVLTRKAHVVEDVSESPILEDFVTVLDPLGRPVREVSVLGAFVGSPFASVPEARDQPNRGDIYHTNAIEVLDGSLAGLIPAFKRGNVLLSMRQLSTIAVLDMTTEQIVWVSSGMWLEQHDPKVLRNGNILLFDNKGGGRQSAIVEFDPVTQELEWAYRGSEECVFFTRMCGASHRLPNGNTIISESDYGRAFEVTPEGDTVWEFVSPYRAGEDDKLIATIFDVVRLPEDFPTDWLD